MCVCTHRYTHATPCMWRWEETFHDLIVSFCLGLKGWKLGHPACITSACITQPVSPDLCPAFLLCWYHLVLGQVGKSVHCGSRAEPWEIVLFCLQDKRIMVSFPAFLMPVINKILINWDRKINFPWSLRLLCVRMTELHFPWKFGGGCFCFVVCVLCYFLRQDFAV